MGQALNLDEPVRASLLGVLLAVGLGTYLARAVPLLLALRPQAAAHRRAGNEPRPAPGRWLELVAPSVMTALLVSSVLPARWGPEALPLLARHLIALAAAWAVARRFQHLGLTVLVGMAVAWLASTLVR